jgi:hypothetical protein
MPNGRIARRQIDDDRVCAGDGKSERDRIGAEQRVDAAGRMDTHRMGIREDDPDHACIGHDLCIVAEPKYVATTDQRNRANASIFRLFDRQLSRGHAGDMTGATVAIDARRRSRLVRDPCLNASVQSPGAQLAHGRIDVVGALDVMTMQIGVYRTVCAELGIFGGAASGAKNSH